LAISTILQLAGGKTVALREVYPQPYRPKRVKLRYSKLTAYVGENIEPSRVAEILNRLGLPTAVSLEVSEEALKEVLLQLLSERLGCKDARLEPTGVEGGYVTCDGKKFKYRFTPQGVEIEP